MLHALIILQENMTNLKEKTGAFAEGKHLSFFYYV